MIEQARGAGRRVLAVEDVGQVAPWEVDLSEPLLLLIGGERHGIPRGLHAGSGSASRSGRTAP